MMRLPESAVVVALRRPGFTSVERMVLSVRHSARVVAAEGKPDKVLSDATTSELLSV